ncbi:MAG: hypothetical protein HC857_01595 [Synechococcales cyanobacterium RU_4_20]|nr:hypothetical protein [Synechococcales cyanobacterium RU_4_20]NJR70246.1 hypothetical protein [Synechococcales cyanobacterium CRU_2_2]
MAFRSYKRLRSVLTDFQITYAEASFVMPQPVPINEAFKTDLIGFVEDGVADNSEYAICENMIAPILKEVWKSFRQDLLLWSHEFLRYDDRLNGILDYLLAKRSPLGKIILDQPYLLVVEAKQDNFDEGWGQCLAAMLAAQKLNDQLESTQGILLNGIVSNGEVWQFGQLKDMQFTQHNRVYLFQDLDALYSMVYAVFQYCHDQLSLVLH